MQWRSFNSQLYSLWHLHWLSAVCQFWKVNFLKHGDVRPSYGAPIADCRIPELMKFWQVISPRRKIPGKPIWLDKAILQIFKPMKMVLCFSCDGVTFKIQNEKRAGLQFTSTDYLNLLLTTLRIRWTIPFSRRKRSWIPSLRGGGGGGLKHVLLIPKAAILLQAFNLMLSPVEDPRQTTGPHFGASLPSQQGSNHPFIITEISQLFYQATWHKQEIPVLSVNRSFQIPYRSLWEDLADWSE